MLEALKRTGKNKIEVLCLFFSGILAGKKFNSKLKSKNKHLQKIENSTYVKHENDTMENIRAFCYKKALYSRTLSIFLFIDIVNYHLKSNEIHPQVLFRKLCVKVYYMNFASRDPVRRDTF